MKEFFSNHLKFKETQQVKYERLHVLQDEGLQERACKWVRENAFRKGAPNITATMFCEYVNTELLPSHHLSPNFPRSICLRTAVRWLHRLGFKPRSHKKGIYIDGHEREDVVSHRKEFLKEAPNLQQSHQPPPPPCSDNPDPPTLPGPSTASELSAPPERHDMKLVMIYHDESIFCTNEGQTWIWGTEDKPGIMVSDFVDEHNGFLRMSPEELAVARASEPAIPSEARELLEYGAGCEGNWTSEKFRPDRKSCTDCRAQVHTCNAHNCVVI